MVEKVLISDFTASPFDSIALFETKHDNTCVEIQTVDLSTNNVTLQDSELFSTSTKIKSAFISQLKRKITEKAHGMQFEFGSPAIIAIHANEWRYDFENYMRIFIEKKLRSVYGANWWERGIAKSIREKVDGKRKKEIEAG